MITDLPMPIIADIFSYLPSGEVRKLYGIYNVKIQAALDFEMDRRATYDTSTFTGHLQACNFYQKKRTKIINCRLHGGFDSNPVFMQFLQECPKLTNLDITMRVFKSQDDITALFSNPVMFRLRKLNISLCKFYGRDRLPSLDLLPIDSLNNLEELRIDSLGSVCPSIAAAIGRLSQLTTLSMHSNILGDEGIAEIVKLKKLTYLRISSNRITDKGAAELPKLPALRYLELANNPIGSAGMVHIGKLTSLIALNIWSCEIDQNGADHFSQLTQLHTLVMDCNPIGSGICNLTDLQNLKVLSVNRTNIGDAEMHSIVQLTNLRVLAIGANQISPKGLRDLNHLKHLKVLDLGLKEGDDIIFSAFPGSRSFIWNNNIEYFKTYFGKIIELSSNNGLIYSRPF